MKILLDNKEVTTLVPESLPMLIHGAEGSGASQYTIALAAKWYSQGYEVIFLCGYPMAEESFVKIVGTSTAKFYTKEKVEEFAEALRNGSSVKRIVFIKNIELFSLDVFQLVSAMDTVVISGDLVKSTIANEVLAKKYITKIFFSPLENIVLPQLNKYEGFVMADDFCGVTRLG